MLFSAERASVSTILGTVCCQRSLGILAAVDGNLMRVSLNPCSSRPMHSHPIAMRHSLQVWLHRDLSGTSSNSSHHELIT